MMDVEQFRKLLRTYRDSVLLDVGLTGRSRAWFKGYFSAFERVDEIAKEVLEFESKEGRG